MSLVWSCGGGTQSAAIAALIIRGELPTPDVAVIADTGREASETWRYFDSTLRTELARVGVNLVRLSHTWAKVDLFGGKEGTTALMPMYTVRDGQPGQVRKFCSNEWKTRPVERYLRSMGIHKADVWIGFSIDELERMRFAPQARFKHTYPLIDRRMSRADCITLVVNQGWGQPPRSSCWMCPYRSNAEWLHLKRTDPEDFERAVMLERTVQDVDGELYLHRSCKPLNEVDFGEAQGSLLDQCGSGNCFT